MTRLEQIQALNETLLAEMPAYQSQAVSFPKDQTAQRRLLRSLMNVRPPIPLNREFLVMQDTLLSAERDSKGVVDGAALPTVSGPSANCRLERGHYPVEGGRDCRCGQLRSAGLFLSLPRLH